MLRTLFRRLLVTHLLVAWVALAAVAAFSSHLFRRYYLAAKQRELVHVAEQIASMAAPMLADPERRDDLALLAHASARALNGRVCIFSRRERGLAAVSEAQPGARPTVTEQEQATDQVSVTTTKVECLPGPALSVAVPIEEFRTGRKVGTVLVRCAVSDINVVVRAERALTVAAGGGAAVLALLLALGLSRPVSRRLEAMSKVATDIADGDLGRRVPEVGTAEVRRLASSLNTMSDSLRRAFGDLERERDRLADILAGMAEGVAAFDRQGRAQVVNERAQELVGLDVAALKDGRLPDELADEIWARRAIEAARTGQVEEKEWTQEIGDTALRFRLTPIRGRFGGAVLLVEDIGQARRLERMRREFVANASHQLRAPLTSMRGFLEAISDGTADTTEARERCVAVALEEVAQMQVLVSQLLALSRLQAHAVEWEQSEVDLREIARRAVRRLEPQAQAKDVRVQLKAGGEVVELKGDAVWLGEAALNLIENSIHYSPRGGEVLVQVGRRNGRGFLEVVDQGPGLASDDLELVWERFQRAANGQPNGGAGLGLAITREIVQQHGGTVLARSAIGVGSTFGFELPISEGSAGATVPKQE